MRADHTTRCGYPLHLTIRAVSALPLSWKAMTGDTILGTACFVSIRGVARSSGSTTANPAVAPDIERGVEGDVDHEFLRRRFPPHKVVVHDNDYTPFDSVTKILLKAVPGMTLERAYALTVEIHTTGAAVPYVGPREQAEAIAAVIRTIGIKVTVEPDE